MTTPDKGNFTLQYVMDVTQKHVLLDINKSVEKTLSRIPDFVDDSKKNLEILNTLSLLESLKKQTMEFFNAISSK
jgi:hypothetical protein